MPKINGELASAFYELADLLELLGEERFRVLAYRRAAETFSSLGRDVSVMSDAQLVGLKGIGKATLAKIREYIATGTMRTLEDTRAAMPPGVREMTRLAGLGPRKALLIHQELGISTLDELRQAITEQRLREVKGLGVKTEENLTRALERIAQSDKRTLLSEALSIAEGMVAVLEKTPECHRVEYAGSLRRMKETIGDIDLLATGSDPAEIMRTFGSLPEVARHLASGGTKASVNVARGIQVDLRVVAPDEFGAAMQYFTGSKQHNVKVRELAIRKGMKLSEYGLFTIKQNERVAAETEEEVYGALGMQAPLPTMREDRGEVELALRGELPNPVHVSDIRGDLHGHSNYSDGRLPLLEMAMLAAERGYSYWAVTDHARNLHIRTLTEEDIERQASEIRLAQERLGDRLRILHGVELNVGADGSLDYADDVIARFDVRIASIHGPPWDFESMTRRLMAAVEHPLVNILGHPTARRIGKREAAEFDMERVFERAERNHVALEINSNPERLDLKDDHVWLARDFGCRFAINTDAHKPADLSNMRLGVGTAQRGWATATEVINTWELPGLIEFLRKR